MPPFLFLLVLLTSTYHPHLANSMPHNNLTDLESLLAFKAQVTDPSGILSSNWTTNTSFCCWTGITCSHRHHHRVAALDLHNTPLQGNISPHLANLSFLSFLDLSNTTLTGSIPNTLGRLHRLQTIVLQRNQISGPLPSTLFNMSSLFGIYMNGNNLSGSLPSNLSLPARPRIQNLSLKDNRLTGQIPSSIARCLDLQTLMLSLNDFSGPVPAELGYLSELRFLHLSVNHLTGKIPSSLGNLTKIFKLEIAANNLTGEIPSNLGYLSNLHFLLLSENGLTGSIPTALLNASMITILELMDNNLNGPIPATIGESMPLLEYLLIEQNRLTGMLDFITSLSNCRNLEHVVVSENELDGSLPSSVGNLSSTLQHLYIEQNRISGHIPAEIGNLTGLLLLNTGYNQLIGEIPLSVTRLHRLQEMFLTDNSIGGSVPSELSRMTSLSTLSIQGNQLSGEIPDSIGNLTRLQMLSLATNRLSSKIPQSLWSLSGFTELYLYQNSLIGSIPVDVSKLSNLYRLDLSENQLAGSISNGFGELQMLTYLDLSSNSFHGQIPQSLGGLINVENMNLSRNFLSGIIPRSVANLRYIESLDLSFNLLEGQIPEGRVFSNLTIASLDGNAALCGAPQLHFPPCPAKTTNSRSTRKLKSLQLILPVIALVLVALSFFVIFKIHRRRKVMVLANTDIPHLVDYMVVSYRDLVRATNNFSRDNLLGRGSFGSVFRGCLNTGLIVAVKVLDLEVDGASKSFDAECRALCTIRHRNLIKIISICFNLDFRALILQFMPNGSLEQWLYSENYRLNLLQRLNIIIDVASALEYLHHHHPHVVLHCDLKPSNVLLDEEMVAHVSDFGIAKLLLDDSGSTASASTPGTLGYIAPEYGSTRKVSKMGDVYGFGILLLETFTGKRPTDVIFDGESSLRECVCKAYPAALWDIVDYNLLKDDSEQQSGEHTSVHQCLSSVIELGLLCSSYSPKERIPMTDVVPRLHKIKVKYLSHLPSA